MKTISTYFRAYDPYADITNTVGQVGSTDWLAWLQQDWTKSFRYESDLGSFTAIKEKRRGRPVWYAHRRRAGQLRRVYLGKSENLTATKLAETARKLNSPQAAVSLRSEIEVTSYGGGDRTGQRGMNIASHIW